MAEQESHEAELPLMSPGRKLQEARESAGLSISDISARTKIAGRHLTAIEEDRFSDLASRAYAIGFARSYARALDMDESAMTDAVRDHLAQEGDAPPPPPAERFEPGDPARVPPSALAWVAGIGAVGLLAVLFLFWRSFVDPAGSLPDLIKEEQAPAGKQTGQPETRPGRTAPAANGPVVLTAMADGIWIRVTDASGKQLVQKELALGETFTVPADADSPKLSTARPDALRLTIGGNEVPRLSETASILRDIPLDAESLALRDGAAEDAGQVTGQATGQAAGQGATGTLGQQTRTAPNSRNTVRSAPPSVSPASASTVSVPVAPETATAPVVSETADVVPTQATPSAISTVQASQLPPTAESAVSPVAETDQTSTVSQ